MAEADVVAGRRWRVTGRVQGVGYRYFVLRSARELGVAGWAANTADGSVVVAGAGTLSVLARLEARLAVGPAAARVEEVRLEWQGEDPGHSGFEIRNGE